MPNLKEVMDDPEKLRQSAERVADSADKLACDKCGEVFYELGKFDDHIYGSVCATSHSPYDNR